MRSRRRRIIARGFETMLARKLFMVCGNPDVVVERGDKLVYCAGAIADLYADHGRRGALRRQALPADLRYGAGAGEAGGRPRHRRATACWRSAIRCAPISRARARCGVDFLFITAGIHAEEVGGRDRPDAKALGSVFAAAGEKPKAVMRSLVW